MSKLFEKRVKDYYSKDAGILGETTELRTGNQWKKDTKIGILNRIKSANNDRTLRGDGGGKNKWGSSGLEDGARKTLEFVKNHVDGVGVLDHVQATVGGLANTLVELISSPEKVVGWAVNNHINTQIAKNSKDYFREKKSHSLENNSSEESSFTDKVKAFIKDSVSDAKQTITGTGREFELGKSFAPGGNRKLEDILKPTSGSSEEVYYDPKEEVKEAVNTLQKDSDDLWKDKSFGNSYEAYLEKKFENTQITQSPNVPSKFQAIDSIVERQIKEINENSEGLKKKYEAKVGENVASYPEKGLESSRYLDDKFLNRRDSLEKKKKPSADDTILDFDTSYYQNFGSEVKKDLIDFRFEIPKKLNNSTFRNVIKFQANLVNYKDNYKGNWSDIRYVGRAESFPVYAGFSRDITFSFKVLASTANDLVPLYQELNNLCKLTAPSYTANTVFMQGTFIELTIGDLLKRQTGVLKSIGLGWQTNYPWDTAKYGEIVVPHVLDVDISFTPVHDFNIERDTNGLFLGGDELRNAIQRRGNGNGNKQQKPDSNAAAFLT